MNLADRIRPLRRLAGRVEATEARLLGRSVLSLLVRRPVLVLTTTGRRSGRARRTTLAYELVDGALVVVGGAGGQTALPDWVANLRAEPRVEVTRERRSTPMRARELHGDERTAMWAVVVERIAAIAAYERRAGRPIPVVVLEPDDR